MYWIWLEPPVTILKFKYVPIFLHLLSSPFTFHKIVLVFSFLKILNLQPRFFNGIIFSHIKSEQISKQKTMNNIFFLFFQIQLETPEIESKPVRWKLASWESKSCWFVTNPSWIRSGFELLEPSRTWATGPDLRYFLKLCPIFVCPVLCQFAK